MKTVSAPLPCAPFTYTPTSGAAAPTLSTTSYITTIKRDPSIKKSYIGPLQQLTTADRNILYASTRVINSSSIYGEKNKDSDGSSLNFAPSVDVVPSYARQTSVKANTDDGTVNEYWVAEKTPENVSIEIPSFVQDDEEIQMGDSALSAASRNGSRIVQRIESIAIEPVVCMNQLTDNILSLNSSTSENQYTLPKSTMSMPVVKTLLEKDR